MDLNTFINRTESEIRLGLHTKIDQRAGQYWLNRLHDVRPRVANKIAGTLSDPFYNDDKIDKFLLLVIDWWDFE